MLSILTMALVIEHRHWLDTTNAFVLRAGRHEQMLHEETFSAGLDPYGKSIMAHHHLQLPPEGRLDFPASL